MKRLLIISPYFPPCNAADMQRVRMSLPYFKEDKWQVEVVCVDPAYADINKDDLLVESIPAEIRIHTVKALPKSLTSKLGLGSLALRSLYYYRKKVNQLLAGGAFDLVYFSTTQFPVCILGAYWKKRFGVPYVIDMQDPWQSDYYQDKPKNQRPPKYWFSYRLNKYLEPIALKSCDGLISVSDKYIDDLKLRYPQISAIPSATITFGAFEPDLQIAANHAAQFEPLLTPGFKSMVYIGRGGADMHKAISPLFEALKQGLDSDETTFNQLKLYFIGTSYAPAGQGKASIITLAEQFGIENNVVEISDRISFYHTLLTLQQADALFIPGSDDPSYTASKIYTYLSVAKPLLAIFNKASSAIGILKEYGVKQVYDYEKVPVAILTTLLKQLIKGELSVDIYKPGAVEKYSARQMTREQCQLFNRVLEKKSR